MNHFWPTEPPSASTLYIQDCGTIYQGYIYTVCISRSEAKQRNLRKKDVCQVVRFCWCERFCTQDHRVSVSTPPVMSVTWRLCVDHTLRKIWALSGLYSGLLGLSWRLHQPEVFPLTTYIVSFIRCNHTNINSSELRKLVEPFDAMVPGNSLYNNNPLPSAYPCYE